MPTHSSCVAVGAFAVAFAAHLTAQSPTLASVRIVSGLARPVYVGSPPGDENRLFVLEQKTGLVRILDRGAPLATPFLDLGTKIKTVGNEVGLLGLAFHPRFASNGYVYVNYTRAADGATMVERYTVSNNDPNVADPNSAFTILGPIAQPFTNHNAGCLAFGPDGYLYASFGDGGSAGDPACRAQNPQEILGKIVRLDVDGGSPYAIPPGNPFVGNPSWRPEIWTLGWRNPWRFSFDRANGDLYVGDVGQNTREEVSFHSGRSQGGENYGWKIMEGTTCFSTNACVNPPVCNTPPLVLPIYDYPTGSDCSVIGGYVYRGCAIPGLAGTYFFGDHCSHRMWSFRYDGTAMSAFQDRTQELAPAALGVGRITSFGEDARGEIYFTDLTGSLYQIVAAGPPPAVNLGFATVGGNGRTPMFEVCGGLGAGQSAQVILRDAAASAAAALVLSDRNNPTVLPFGTLVPVPPLAVAATMTDSTGRIEFAVNGGGGPASVFGQWGILDVGATAGVALSNALRFDFP